MNKMGFNVKMGGDGLLYTILVVVLFLYIFNMNDIYQLISKAKNSEVFKGEAKEEEVLPNDNEKEEEQYNAVKPEGTEYVVCTKEDSAEGGTLSSTVKLYYTDFKLKSIVEDLKYDGNTDEYINYVYSENSKFKKRQENNKDLEGYSVIPQNTSQTTLKVNSVYVLSKLDLKKIKLEKGEELTVSGIYNQNTAEVTQEYVNMGFVCEW